MRLPAAYSAGLQLIVVQLVSLRSSRFPLTVYDGPVAEGTPLRRRSHKRMLQLAIRFISEGMVVPCTLRLKVDGGGWQDYSRRKIRVACSDGCRMCRND